MLLLHRRECLFVELTQAKTARHGERVIQHEAELFSVSHFPPLLGKRGTGYGLQVRRTPYSVQPWDIWPSHVDVCLLFARFRKGNGPWPNCHESHDHTSYFAGCVDMT